MSPRRSDGPHTPPSDPPTVAAPEGTRAKNLGAYYTAPTVAHFLARWAIRAASDTILDPSAGGGVFLGAAYQQLQTLGGHSTRQLFGVELDPDTHQALTLQLQLTTQMPPDQLLHQDFFQLPAGALEVDVLLGNPPFIRYQRVKSQERTRALEAAKMQGVKLSALSSSWAPFLVHAVSMLRPGGRVGMVLPQELTFARYARPVLEFLCQRFERVALLTFRQKLFPRLGEDTLLLLAEGHGRPFLEMTVHDLNGPEALQSLPQAGFPVSIPAASPPIQSQLSAGSTPKTPISPLAPLPAAHTPGARKLDPQALASSTTRLLESYLPPETRALYQQLRGNARVARLGTIADVGIGYVTGNNAFFHPALETAHQAGILASELQPAVFRARGFRGLSLTTEDWQRGCTQGDAGFLLHPPPDCPPSPGLITYLEKGEAAGVPLGFKCRKRTPWYRVPGVYRPDALLAYMSGEETLLVADGAGIVAPNTLHVLRFRADSPLTPLLLAASWLSTLTALSCELEGHALGGGLLKLEPGEASSVLVVIPDPAVLSPDTLSELDGLVRTGDRSRARARIDDLLLHQMLGLTADQLEWLRLGLSQLRARRRRRPL